MAEENKLGCVCFICSKGEGKFITSSRIAGIRESSAQRGDGLSDNLMPDESQVTVHSNCIKTYCSTVHIKRAINKRLLSDTAESQSSRLSPKRLRSSVTFSFLCHCIFCGEDCCVDRPSKHPDRWRESYLCRTADRSGQVSFKQSILLRANYRNDNWGKDVSMRVCAAISDLHAADARYHKDCMSKFFSNKPLSTKLASHDESFDMLINIMQEDKTRIWNSVDLHKKYMDLGGTELSRRRLLEDLSTVTDLLVLSSPGIASLIIFQSAASTHLHIIADGEDDEAVNISKIGNKIAAECRKCDASTYKSRISMDVIVDDCSATLMALLAEVSQKLDSTMPAAMIGNIVNSIVTGQATSLQIAIAVLLNEHRYFVEQLHGFGVTSSYEELRRFKISAASAAAHDRDGIGNINSHDGLVQVVADNFDAEISSLNGKKMTHGLAMIITHSKQSSKANLTTSTDLMPNIKRLTVEQIKARNLSLGEVSVKRYSGSKKPDMPESFASRSPVSLSMLCQTILCQNKASMKDMAFLNAVIRTRQCPEFGGFNTKLSRDSMHHLQPKTEVVYVPLLDMSPAEPDTMMTAMYEAQRLTELTGQEWTVFTNDQQLYRLSVHITWQHGNMFPKFLPRLGGMHMLMSFVGAVGFLMTGSGLEEVLQSAFSGVKKLLSGKKFPQNVRALRFVAEETLRAIIEREDLHSIDELLVILEDYSQRSATTKLWVDCLIKPVFIMMSFVRAEREGDWALHLLTVEQMMPYFFASGHFNYARYGLYYLRSMQRLPPTVLNRFLNGEHVMRHNFGLWNGLWSDMFIETTYMRYGHGPRGIIGSTLNESTLAIWALSAGTLGQLIHDLNSMTTGDMANTVTCHSEERTTRIASDAEDRQNIRQCLSLCIDIFDTTNHPESGIVDVFSGRVWDDRRINVQRAISLGKAHMKEYEGNWPLSFHKPLKRNVFNMSSTHGGSRKAENTNEMNSELIYARCMGIMTSGRECLTLESLFKHELSANPTSIFDTSGNMRQTSKAVFKAKLVVEAGVRNKLLPKVVIIDGCALLWTVVWPASPAVVSDYVTAVVHAIKQRADKADIVHVVFDRYYNMSTKDSCRSHRQKGCCRSYKLLETAPLPKQDNVLNVTENKKQIIECVVARLRNIPITDSHRFVITGPDEHPFQVGLGPIQVAVKHEEADVIIAYHMIQEACSGNSPINVISDDTDVLLILCHHLHACTGGMSSDVKLTMESCSGSRSIIDVNAVVQKHVGIVDNLLSAHALTGCDTVSSFAGIGKTKVMNKLKVFHNCIDLGDPHSLLDDVVCSAGKFVATLYGHNIDSSFETLRHASFSKAIGNRKLLPPKLCKLPPTMPAFKLHCARAHFQVALWKSAGQPIPPAIDATEYGFQVNQNLLQAVKLPAGELCVPEEVMNLIKCNCTTHCQTKHCSCIKLSLLCTAFCKCKGSRLCQNPANVVQDTNSDTDVDGSDID